MTTRPRSENRERATRLLAHYVTSLMKAHNLHVDGDTYAELAECIDATVDAAVEEARRERVEALGA